MKTNLLHTSIVAVLAATAAFAQSSTPLKTTVPFDFNVGTQALPAGQYTLDRGPASRTMMIRSDDGRGAAIVLAQPMFSVVARDAGKLVFHRYGSTYFLSEVWSSGNDGQKLPTTNPERELAAMRATPVHATIAAAQ